MTRADLTEQQQKINDNAPSNWTHDEKLGMATYDERTWREQQQPKHAPAPAAPTADALTRQIRAIVREELARRDEPMAHAIADAIKVGVEWGVRPFLVRINALEQLHAPLHHAGVWQKGTSYAPQTITTHNGVMVLRNRSK